MHASDDAALLVRRLREVELLYGLNGFHSEGSGPVPSPALYLLHREGAPWQIPLSRESWPVVQNGCEWTILNLANLMPTHPDMLHRLVGPGFFAVAFAYEMWAVFGTVDDGRVESDAAVMADPERVSARLVIGVTRTQERGALVRREDHPDELLLMSDGDDWTVAGDIMAALVELVAALDHGRPD